MQKSLCQSEIGKMRRVRARGSARLHGNCGDLSNDILDGIPLGRADLRGRVRARAGESAGPTSPANPANPATTKRVCL